MDNKGTAERKKVKNDEKRVRIYVAGLLTKGSSRFNIVRAFQAGNRIRGMGGYPFVPHLFFFWDLVFAKPYEEWIELDLAWLETCDALYRMDGESKGADIEVAHAKKCGIPVIEELQKLREFIEERL